MDILKKSYIVEPILVQLGLIYFFNIIGVKMNQNLSAIATFLVVLLGVAKGDDLNRQSIVFYDETPDVFYCPQEKPVYLEGNLCYINKDG